MADKKTNSKALHTELRNKYLAAITGMLQKQGDEILVVSSNQIAIPTLDSEGNDEYVIITVKVPTGSRDGTPYDAYSEAQGYEMTQRKNAEKAAANAKKKAEKVERDKAARAAKAKAKAEAKAKDGEE